MDMEVDEQEAPLQPPGQPPEEEEEEEEAPIKVVRNYQRPAHRPGMPAYDPTKYAVSPITGRSWLLCGVLCNGTARGREEARHVLRKGTGAVSMHSTLAVVMLFAFVAGARTWKLQHLGQLQLTSHVPLLPPPPLPLAHCAWCPGELVPLEEMAEHMRISLIDPRWKEQRDAMLSKLKDTTKAGDEEISRNLLSLARTRPDIFGGWRAEGVGGVGLFSREGRSASLLWILGVCWGGGGGLSNQVVSKPECGVCAATCTQNQGPFLWHRVTRLHWMKCNAWLTSWVSVSSTT
jgi:hypothetical protein